MFARNLRRHSTPISAVALATVIHVVSNRCHLEGKLDEKSGTSTTTTTTTNTTVDKGGVGRESFYGYCPKSQMHEPKRPYPCWDDDWDSKHKNRKMTGGVTRHIILVRHGQYDETHKEDEKRKLTELGRKQAHLTGLRIAEMIKGGGERLSSSGKEDVAVNTATEDSDSKNENGESLFKPCQVGSIHVSGMTRAKETAEIIGESLPNYIIRSKPDPLLNEGIPAPIIPSRPELDIEEDLAKNGNRIEKAFQKYFSRSTDDAAIAPPLDNDNYDDNDVKKRNIPEERKDEFEIIVCHGNVIRFFFCRALQLPPEAWLRMSTYNCSLTYIMITPSGRVSCRMMGDIGHLGYENSTFSMHHGFV